MSAAPVLIGCAHGTRGPAGRRTVADVLLAARRRRPDLDVAAAVDGVPGALAAAPLGPDPRLADLLAERLREAGAAGGDAVVLAAAGSSDPRSAQAAGEAVGLLAERWDGPVVAGFGAAARPSVAEAVAALRRDGARRVTVAAYLLAPGHFHDRLAAAGADVVTAPLCAPGAPDARVVDIVLDRYSGAVSLLG